MPKALQSLSKEVQAVLLTAFLSTFLFAVGAMKHSTDDSFILFRYIDNIAHGNGFVYNVGERVLGSTTPLFTLLLAAIKFILFFIATPTLVAWVTILLLSASSLYLYRLGRMFASENVSLLLVLVFALDLSKIVAEGMETGLFIFTLLAFLYYLFKRENKLAAVFLALVVLTRPDAVLVAGLAFAYWWMRDGFENTIKFSVMSVAVALPWLVFATLYFGSFVPQSLITKLHIHAIVNIPRFQALKAQLAGMSRLYWGKIFDPDNFILQSIVNLLPYLFLVAFGVWKKLSRENWIVFAIPLAYFVTYAASNTLMWSWYISQAEPLWILISFFGVAAVFEKLKDRKWKAVFVALLLLGPAYFWLYGVASRDQGNKLSNVSIAQYISDRMQPGDSIAINNIGIIGYVLPNVRIIDLFGLVNDYAFRFYPAAGGCVDTSRLYGIPSSLVMFAMPDWLVAGDRELDPCFVRSQWFSSHYALEDYPGPAEVTVWKKIRP
jgi:hypothetical protein